MLEVYSMIYARMLEWPAEMRAQIWLNPVWRKDSIEAHVFFQRNGETLRFDWEVYGEEFSVSFNDWTEEDVDRFVSRLQTAIAEEIVIRGL